MFVAAALALRRLAGLNRKKDVLGYACDLMEAVQQSQQSYCRWDSDAQSAVPGILAAALPTATASASTDTLDLPPSAAEQSMLHRALHAEGRVDGMQALLREQALVLNAMRAELASAREAAAVAAAARREAEGRLESRVAGLRRQLERAHAVIAEQARHRQGSTAVLDRLQQRLAEAEAREAMERRRAESSTRMAQNYHIASWQHQCARTLAEQCWQATEERCVELQCSLQRERHFATTPLGRSQFGAAALAQEGAPASVISKSAAPWAAGKMDEKDGLMIGAVWMRCASQTVDLELF